MDWLKTLLETSPLTALFLVIAAGYFVGEVNVKGFALGSGAVLFVGLACGAFAPNAAPPAMLGTLGLQNGDRLEKINGYDMASPEKALEAYARLRTAPSLSVQLTRRGAPVTLEIQIK